MKKTLRHLWSQLYLVYRILIIITTLWKKKNTEYLNDVIASKDQIIDKLTSDVQNFKKIISELSNKNNLLKKELDRLQESKESSKREKKTKAQEMYDDILNDEKKLHYYTGFESLNSYNHLFNTLEDDFPKFKYYNMKQSDSPRYDRWLIIPFQIQYLLVLMRLRLNLGEQDLAYRFGISETTVTKYWKTWIRLLDNRLRQVNIFPMPEIVDEFRPLIFKEKGYDTVDGILVTTEIYLETPSSYRIQGETYSNYNHHNTVKGLVAFAPNGFLIFASELAPGRLSDKDLTIDSKILDTFRPGRSVIADPEFLIEEECAKKGLILNMLPFMNVRPQLSAGDESKSQSKEILRVHIERVISRLKCFRILNGVYPNSMHTELNCIWHICCRLVNWTNKPLLD